jgi:hypothetical protein
VAKSIIFSEKLVIVRIQQASELKNIFNNFIGDTSGKKYGIIL